MENVTTKKNLSKTYYNAYIVYLLLAILSDNLTICNSKRE